MSCAYFSDCPRITIMPISPSYTVKVGSLAFLFCQADGNPNPRVQWYKGEVPAVPIHFEFQQFFFIPTGFPQSVTYTCRAWNSICVNHRSENITVIVQQ